MKPLINSESRKRPVNLTLSEDLVNQARSLTGNLSGIVESLLAEYIERERIERQARENTAVATASTWNAFNAKRGSFADEYSSL